MIRVLVFLAAAFVACAPSSAVAAPLFIRTLSCVTETLQVTTPSPGSTGGIITAVAEAQESPRHNVARLHLDLQIQERTATDWVPYTSGGQVETFTKYPGSRIHRVWTLTADAAPIEGLLASGVQMRIYAAFDGSCHQQPIGPGLYYALRLPPVLL